MKQNTDELRLDETYSFNVVVDIQGTKFSGKLNLSPEKCTIRVSGETSDNRHADFTWGNVDRLECKSSGTNFILLNLRITNAFHGVLERHPKVINTFEIGYEIDYVIYTRAQSTRNARFSGFELDSSSIALWIGETKTQHEIISKFNSGTLFADNEEIPFEFVQRIDELGSALVGYATSMHYSILEFSAGIRFPPKFTMLFDEEKTGAETIDVFNNLRDFLSIVIGRKILFKTIYLLSSKFSSFSSPTLYFSEPKTMSNEEGYVMFPLGCNAVRNNSGLPEFPLKSINSYFNAKNEVRSHFKKYLKYRLLENPEEKFLGYFRLLEKLTFQKDSFVDDVKLGTLLDRVETFVSRYFDNRAATKKLLKQIQRANHSKLNTASCIIKFMKELPAVLYDSWVFGKPDIESICKLRNDLIHANETEFNEKDIEIRAKFIEMLLLIALFKAIGISPKSMTLILPRMQGYSWIKKRIEPTLITRMNSEDREES